MELNDVEEKILRSFKDEDIMTLKMITNRVRKTMPGISKQRVWGALQLLVARNLIRKVERGTYRKIQVKGFKNRDDLKIIRLKGTKEILKNLENRAYTWTQFQNSCEDIVSQSTFYIRVKQLEKLGFIDTKTVFKNKKEFKVYFLTKKGKKMLESMRRIKG